MENLRQEIERDFFIESMLKYTRKSPFYFWFEYTDPYYGSNSDRDELDDDRTLDLIFHFRLPARFFPRFFSTMELSRKL